MRVKAVFWHPLNLRAEEWCGRTFLHRNRLAFKDKNGKRHDVLHGCPGICRCVGKCREVGRVHGSSGPM